MVIGSIICHAQSESAGSHCQDVFGSATAKQILGTAKHILALGPPQCSYGLPPRIVWTCGFTLSVEYATPTARGALGLGHTVHRPVLCVSQLSRAGRSMWSNARCRTSVWDKKRDGLPTYSRASAITATPALRRPKSVHEQAFATILMVIGAYPPEGLWGYN